ncbi:hypothetical protein CAOG_00914 [Capsaspora owczarzaki ATCC 30864]|uniref:hypothetical protein n=1 Tax=Capsaspora owczarzaki (strain ATCC 30864) TaxID=595528 RepID=UPI0001FE5876|nr:hypothetical protein CAOG_00914 [Capsaspora owczarzaki ATCC 30864]|eukprot:XP_004365785.1 hypothetical protein CAOG_00914 [Capsaspora owczarzaki ATCC 30864]
MGMGMSMAAAGGGGLLGGPSDSPLVSLNPALNSFAPTGRDPAEDSDPFAIFRKPSAFAVLDDPFAAIAAPTSSTKFAAGPRILGARTAAGLCALHWAALGEHVEVLEFILSYSTEGPNAIPASATAAATDMGNSSSSSSNNNNSDASSNGAKVVSLVDTVEPWMLELAPELAAAFAQAPPTQASAPHPGHRGAAAGGAAAAANPYAFSVDDRIPDGSTALHLACKGGSGPIIHSLLVHGADPYLLDGKGFNTLHLAAQRGHIVVTQFLLHNVALDVNTRDKEGRTPLMWAVFNKVDMAMVSMLMKEGAQVNATDMNNSTALHLAARSGNSAAWRALLEAKATMGHDSRKMTPLQRAEEAGHGSLIEYYEQNRAASSSKRKTIPEARKKLYQKYGSVIGLPVVLFVVSALPLWQGLILLALLGFLFGRVSPMLQLANGGGLNTGLVSLGHTAYWTAVVLYFAIGVYDNGVALRVHGIFIATCAVLLYFWWRVVTTDPGVIQPKTHGADPSDSRRQLLRQLLVENVSDRQFCATCSVRKPLRSKHCAVCNVCVARFDHHCPWIGVCVGAKNHRYFVLFVTFLLACTSWFVYMIGAYTQHRMAQLPPVQLDWHWLVPPGVEFLWRSFNIAPSLIYFAVFTMIFVAFVLTVCVTQFRQIFMNLTTNEMANFGRYAYLQRVKSAQELTVERAKATAELQAERRKQAAADKKKPVDAEAAAADADTAAAEAASSVATVAYFNPFDAGPLRNLLEFFGAGGNAKYSWDAIYDVPEHLKPRLTAGELSVIIA